MGDAPEPPNADLDGYVLALLKEIAEAVCRAGRSRLRTAYECGEMRFTLGGAKKQGKPATTGREGLDLPERVAKQSKKVRRVYLALRAARREKGDEAEIWQQDIFDDLGGEDAADPVSLRHVYRAVKILCKIGEVRKSERYGYLIGGQQPTLTF